MEIINKSSRRTEVSLKTIEMDCQNISESDFVKIMKSSLEECNNFYKEFVLPKYEKYLFKTSEKTIADIVLSAKEYANNRWKTAKRRLKYVEDEKAEIERFCKKSYFHAMDEHGELYFGLDGNCGTTVSGKTQVFKLNCTDEELIESYRILLKSKFFTKAIGLRFTYEVSNDFANEEIYVTAGRGKIKLIFPKDVEEIVENEKNKLLKEMSHYYGCGSGKYTGD